MIFDPQIDFFGLKKIFHQKIDFFTQKVRKNAKSKKGIFGLQTLFISEIQHFLNFGPFSTPLRAESSDFWLGLVLLPETGLLG